MTVNRLATYTFMEAIDRIAVCEDLDELSYLCTVLSWEREYYPMFYRQVILCALKTKKLSLENQIPS